MLDKKINIINEETFIGDDNLTYKKVEYEILTPRKTYLKGIISGKYRGIKIDDDYDRADLFDFEIYEADVKSETSKDFRANKPFVFAKDFENVFNKRKIKGQVFPKEKLPKTLPVTITADEKSFGVNVLEPQLFEFEIIRKLHQIDGDEIFGSFNAYLTGYIIDETKEIVEEVILFENKINHDHKVATICVGSDVETGKTETRNNYFRREYKCKNHNDTVWGNWEYLKNNKRSNFNPQNNQGCVYHAFGIVGILFGLVFMVFLLLQIPVILTTQFQFKVST